LWQLATIDCKSFNFKKRLKISVDSMEMSRLMIIEKDPNDNTEESADFGHTAPLN